MNNLVSDNLPLATRQANAVFVWKAGRAVTLAEFLGDVAQCVSVLPDGDFICNVCEDQYWFSVAFCAVIVRGSCNLLPANHRQRTLADIADQYAGCPLLADKAFAQLGFSQVISVPDACAGSVSNTRVPLIPTAQLVARVFTSGSTGASVAIDKRWDNLVVGANHNIRVLNDINAGNDFCVSTVAPSHMYGLEWSVVAPLQGASTQFCGNALLPANVQQALGSVTGRRRLISTPVHLNALLRSDLDFPPVDVIMSATAPLSESLAAAVEQRFAGTVLEIYGCSEVGSMASRQPVKNSAWHFHAAYEVAVNADRVELSASHLECPVPLADQLEFAPDGSFAILGRANDLLKVAGKRESMQRLNRLLNEVDGVIDGAFFERPATAEDDFRRLTAFVVGTENCLAQVRQQLSEQIDPVFMPRPLYRVDALPREASGKLPRGNLLELLHHLEQDSKGE